LQFFKPENYFEVRRALEQAGRQDLIGSGCDCLIPEIPPRDAFERRRQDARSALSTQHPDRDKATKRRQPAPPKAGYRPKRKTAERRPRP
jgi:hypothetical protein